MSRERPRRADAESVIVLYLAARTKQLPPHVQRTHFFPLARAQWATRFLIFAIVNTLAFFGLNSGRRRRQTGTKTAVEPRQRRVPSTRLNIGTKEHIAIFTGRALSERLSTQRLRESISSSGSHVAGAATAENASLEITANNRIIKIKICYRSDRTGASRGPTGYPRCRQIERSHNLTFPQRQKMMTVNFRPWICFPSAQRLPFGVFRAPRTRTCWPIDGDGDCFSVLGNDDHTQTQSIGETTITHFVVTAWCAAPDFHSFLFIRSPFYRRKTLLDSKLSQ